MGKRVNRKFRIADVVIETKCDEFLLAPEFDLFECSLGEKTEILWDFTTETPPEPIERLEWKDMGGFKLARMADTVYAKYLVPSYHLLDMIIYKNNYRNVTFYIPKEEEFQTRDLYIRKMVPCILAFAREAFFHVMLNQYQGISIHSVSIIYEEKGIVFSAMSGTGKSTHTNMWAERYQTPILDGDVTVCRMIDGKPVIYGLPWSGSSRMFLNRSVDLRALVFLEQAPKNEVKQLELGETFKRLYARSFTSVWFEDIFKKAATLTEQICKSGVTSYLLKCLPDYEAVDLIKKTLDNEKLP